jgi:hypothetical protein
MARRTTKRSETSPLVTTLDGRVLLDARLVLESADYRRLCSAVRLNGRRVFIGLELSEGESREVGRALDDAAAEAAARIVARSRRRPKTA